MTYKTEMLSVLSYEMLYEIEQIGKIKGIHRYGSHVYGTNRIDSDEDFIVIIEDNHFGQNRFEISNQTVHLYTEGEIELYMNNHDVPLIETHFKYGLLPDFKIDLGKLRSSFSSVANNSWVKGKKKLIVPADYDKKLAIKSIFHSIRILDYGIQIATTGKIYSWFKYNWLLIQLYELAGHMDHIELWETINSIYLSLYKELKSQFRNNIPKNLMEHGSKKVKLISILKRNNINPTKNLIKDLMDL